MLRSRFVALLVLPFLAAGCRGRGEAVDGARLALHGPASTATSFAYVDGRAWVSGPAGTWVVDSAGRPATGWAGARGSLVPGAKGAFLVDSSGGLTVLDPRAPTVGATRPRGALGGWAPDPSGRWVWLARPSGGVAAADAASLALRFGFAGRGGRGTALAVSPDGDRLYTAATGRKEDLLVWDAQSGRVLACVASPVPLSALAARADGWVFGVGEGVIGVSAVAFRPTGEGLEVAWRERIPGDLGGRARIGLPPAGKEIAVVLGGADGGAVTVSAADGKVLERWAEVLDARYAPGGVLTVLRRGEIVTPRRKAAARER